MKKTLLSLLAVAGLGTAAHAQALVAGWDFSQYAGDGIGSTDGLALTSILTANYSSLDLTGGAGAESAAFGTLYYDGTHGSTDAGINGSTDAIWPTTNSLTSNLAAGGPGSFDNHGLLDSEGQTFTEYLSLKNQSAVSLVFMVDLSSAGLVGSDWEISLGGLAEGGASTVTLDFSTDGISFVNAGQFNFTALDTAYSLNLSGLSTDSAFVRLNMTTAGTTIDNVAISALTAAAIPEPSTYAMIAGSLALSIAAYRRRNRAAA